ncbi:MAG: HDIG domain-containing protein [Spirochaetaceae bacterium]|jgi:putative nucleotidyltransferase with HDIG domain|nr:HDIG domain-containing protein [Spirochaetaceae bacterium]
MNTIKTNPVKTDARLTLMTALKLLGGYVREHYQYLAVLLFTFAALGAVAFLNIATSNTIVSYSLSDYEIGQIADRTITAVKTLPADAENPASLLKGEKITRKGFPITEGDYQKLKKMAETRSYIDYRAFADTMLYLLLVLIFWFFLFSITAPAGKARTGEFVMFSCFLALIYVLAVFARKIHFFDTAFALPIASPGALCVILAVIIYGRNVAVAFSVIVFLVVLNAASYEVAAPLFVLASCIASVRIVRNISRRIDMVAASILLALLNTVFMVALKIIFTASFVDSPTLLPAIAFNGFISCILSLGLLTPLEYLLNTASVFRLMDLSDLNTPLMRRFMLTAPGTYNHTLMVATLAESACTEIGANALLARIGAYYHDLGKMEHPEYFVENQTGYNRHDEINPRLSVAVIKSHVKKGVEKCRQLHLPEEVINIVSEHHGNGVIAYFFNEAKKQEENVDQEDFSYSGSPPESRESAVVMLADTVEAACRTLEKPTASRLEKFIDQLCAAKVEHHQLDRCSLTFRELDQIKNAFLQILCGYYHSRIEYPDQKDPDAKEGGQRPEGGKE